VQHLGKAFAVITLAVLVLPWVISLHQAPTYEATVKMLVGQESQEKPYVSWTYDGGGLQELTVTVARAVPTVPVARAVVERLNMPEESAKEVLRNTSAAQDPGTLIVNVTYKSSDPERAQLIANTLGQVASQRMSEVNVGNGITATVLEPATLPEKPVSPDPVRNSIIGLVLGGLLGVVLAFLLEYVDDSWGSPEEVEEVSGVPTFGVIPKFEILEHKKAEVLAGKKGEQ